SPNDHAMIGTVNGNVCSHRPRHRLAGRSPDPRTGSAPRRPLHRARRPFQRYGLPSRGMTLAARPGGVLLAVLVVVALLALGAYTFTEWMLAEAEATRMFERYTQARLFAESGIEMAVHVLSDPLIEGGQ